MTLKIVQRSESALVAMDLIYDHQSKGEKYKFPYNIQYCHVQKVHFHCVNGIVLVCECVCACVLGT